MCPPAQDGKSLQSYGRVTRASREPALSGAEGSSRAGTPGAPSTSGDPGVTITRSRTFSQTEPTLSEVEGGVRATQACPAQLRHIILLMEISVVQLGALDYAEGLGVQQRLVELRKSGQIGDVLLLLEHAPVITLGRNAKAANVLASTEQLAARGVEVFECDRGGDFTFHGPGQLVVNPIFDLRGFSSHPSAISHQQLTEESFPSWRKTLGAVDYVRRLEEVLIRTCADFGIATKRVPGLTGALTQAAP